MAARVRIANALRRLADRIDPLPTLNLRFIQQRILGLVCAIDARGRGDGVRLELIKRLSQSLTPDEADPHKTINPRSNHERRTA